MTKITTLLFDLGNVVFKWSFESMFHYLSRRYNTNIENFQKIFHVDEMYKKYEISGISTREYINHFSQMIGIQLNKTDFEKIWNSIFKEEVEGMNDLLQLLKNNYQLAALSNTNEIHCTYMKEKFKILFKHFGHIYYSHIMKLRKPDKEAFDYVFASLNIKPEEVLFFDDFKENVDGAKNIGLHAIHVTDFQSILSGLKEHGIPVNLSV